MGGLKSGCLTNRGPYMDSLILLIAIGFVIGTIGTLIGAGGGFLLVPLLLLTQPDMPPDIVTGISIAIVAANAIAGSAAYARSRRIDYKIGLLFAACTIPGSIIGVFLTDYIPKTAFNIVFGLLLLALSAYLFIKNKKRAAAPLSVATKPPKGKRWKSATLTDKGGTVFTYSYNATQGALISVVVGFLSPILGIGGGIIHVPAMVNWLNIPVPVATATSQFILAIMSAISVAVHAFQGDYNSSDVLRMIGGLIAGVVPGAFFGAYLSRRLPTAVIVKVLAVCLALVGVRILLGPL